MPAKSQIPKTDHVGTRFFATRRQSWWPGTAPSREKANIIRDAEVTDAVTQKNCATTQMKSSASAQSWLIEFAQIQGTSSPRALTVSSAPWLLGIANVTARRRIQPKITETTTEVHIPVAAIREALLVSSAVCADASKPVIVYCGSSMPSPSTSRNASPNEVVPSPKPELLIVFVNTYESDWWLSGTMIRIATITTTPAMCHHAEIMFSPDVRRMFSRLIRAAVDRKIAYRMYVEASNDAPNQSFMCSVYENQKSKRACPKSA